MNMLNLLIAAIEIALAPTGTNDMTKAVLSAVDRVRAAGGGEICLASGAYHFRTTTAMSFYVSNHDHPGTRHVFLPITHVTNLVLRCDGRAEFLFHGAGIALGLQDTRNVTLKGIGVDWDRPYYSEARFVRFDGGRPVLSFDPKQFPMRIDEKGRLVAVGEGWEKDPKLAQAFDAHDRAYKGSAWFSGRADDLGAGVYRLDEDWTKKFPRPLAPSDAVVVRSGWRPDPAVHLNRAHDTELEDCVIRAAAGMGLIAQRSENVTVRGSGRAADRTAGAFARAETGRMTSLQADATHFSNCRGKIVVENCLFEGMVDDAINVHSTCLQVEAMPSPTEIRCRYKHSQSVGFEVFLPGERLRGIRGRTLEPSDAMVVVTGVTMRAPDLVDLTLSAPLPDGLGVGDAVENADWQPSVDFRNNIVRNSSPRATLFTTPGRVVCEGNLFDHVAAQAMHLSADAWDWYESGACEDVTIRRNVFRDCLLVRGKGVIQIDPNVKDLKAQRRRYHRNIVIEGNVFEQTRGPLLYARSVSNLVWRANSTTGATGFDVDFCDNVKIEK